MNTLTFWVHVKLSYRIVSYEDKHLSLRWYCCDAVEAAATVCGLDCSLFTVEQAEQLIITHLQQLVRSWTPIQQLLGYSIIGLRGQEGRRRNASTRWRYVVVNESAPPRPPRSRRPWLLVGISRDTTMWRPPAVILSCRSTPLRPVDEDFTQMVGRRQAVVTPSARGFWVSCI